MKVIETTPNSVVDEHTLFCFVQANDVVSARYSGGAIKRGFLVGKKLGSKLHFSYCQVQVDGKIGAGRSSAKLSLSENGKLQMTEYFERDTEAQERGMNILQQL